MDFINKSTIIIKNIPNYDDIINTDFKEMIIPNDHIIKKILSSPDIKERHKQTLYKLLYLSKNEKLTVKYYFGIPNIGRLLVKNNISLFFVPKSIRHNICIENNMVDFDIVKCYQTIIYEIGKNNGYEFKSTKYYINNFNELVIELKSYYSDKLSPIDIKKLFNSLLFGSNYFMWIRHLTENNILKDSKLFDKIYSELNKRKTIIKIKTLIMHPIINDYIKEIKIFTDLIVNNNKDLIDHIIKHLESKKKKITNKKIKDNLLYYFFGTIETYIIVSAYNFLLDNKIISKENCIFEYDGLSFQFYGDDCKVQQILDDLNNFISMKTKTNIKFSRKFFTEATDIS